MANLTYGEKATINCCLRAEIREQQKNLKRLQKEKETDITKVNIKATKRDIERLNGIISKLGGKPDTATPTTRTATAKRGTAKKASKKIIPSTTKKKKH